MRIRPLLVALFATVAMVATTVPAAAGDPPRAQSWTTTVARGLGAWFDVYDWSLAHTGGRPRVGPRTIDELADQGVRTLYIQTARTNRPEDVTDRALLASLIDRAHARGIAVVGWYLPTLEDVDRDLRRFRAALELDIDGFALDIESTDVADPVERNRRLLDLARRMRSIAGDRALIATVLPPVALEDIVPDDYWPDFPYRELAGYFDVMQPMVYFTYRDPGEPGGEWRDAEAYVAENVRRIRQRTGNPDELVHVIGGIADETTVADVEGMTRAAVATGVMGSSLYDVVTTGDGLWPPMRAWRTLHEPGGTRFVDVASTNPHGRDVEVLADRGVTFGCATDLYCPTAGVTRGQMAAFLRRSLDLAPRPERFVDVAADATFARDIGAIAAAGITLGCNPPANDRYCPDDVVTREQMAAFLRRALDLPQRSASFVDVAPDATFANDIGAIAAAGITLGCNPPANDHYCPSAPVTRAQMASFLVRSVRD